MMGPSESIAIPETATRKKRSTSYSLSPEDRTFLPGYHQKQELITIKSPFNNELIAESIEQHHYLSSDAREQYLVTCNDGFFQNANGELLNGPFIYVLHPKLRLYAVNIHLNINHSHLSSGLPVKGAGVLYFEFGRLITMSNDSGHYKPTFFEMQDALDWFYEQTESPFLFEDHSHQDKDLELRGIRYYCKGNDCLNELDTQQLSEELYHLKVSALEHLEMRQQPSNESQKISSSSELSEDGESCYYSQVSGAEVKPPMGDSILDCPDLVQHTCFYRLSLSGSISRYNGLPSHVPRKKQ